MDFSAVIGAQAVEESGEDIGLGGGLKVVPALVDDTNDGAFHMF